MSAPVPPAPTPNGASDREAELQSALERTLANFRSALAGRPIRDAAETIAEAEYALKAMPIAEVKVSGVSELAEQIRARGCAVVVFQPSDMATFGNAEVPKEERLAEIRSNLQDRLVETGWEVIQGMLGTNDAEREDGDLHEEDQRTAARPQEAS